MTELKITPEPEAEQYPIEPRYHPIHKLPRKVYDFLASAKLAMALLVAILCCCVAGVTIWRELKKGTLPSFIPESMLRISKMWSRAGMENRRRLISEGQIPRPLGRRCNPPRTAANWMSLDTPLLAAG